MRNTKLLKIFALLFSALILLSAAACSAPSQTGNDEGTGCVFTINGREFDLDYSSDFYMLHYYVNFDFHSETVGSYRFISASEDGETLFEIRIVYYEGNTMEDTLEGIEFDTSEKTVNGMGCRYFEYTNEELSGHTYVFYYYGNSYTIEFVSKYDTSSLESAFFNGVKFYSEEV